MATKDLQLLLLALLKLLNLYACTTQVQHFQDVKCWSGGVLCVQFMTTYLDLVSPARCKQYHASMDDAWKLTCELISCSMPA